MEFVTEDGSYLSRNLYDMTTIKVAMGKYNPTRKFLNEVADTLVADMINCVKSGGDANKITAKLVYDDSFP